MILFGDLDFFTSDYVRNKSGQGLWLGFKTLLEEGSHVYRYLLFLMALSLPNTKVFMDVCDRFGPIFPTRYYGVSDVI